jgi:hypothetical protein
MSLFGGGGAGRAPPLVATDYPSGPKKDRVEYMETVDTSSVTATIISALSGGAFGSVIGHILSNTLRAKREKHQDIRRKVTEAVATIGIGQQYMEWISWFGVHYPVPKPKYIRPYPNSDAPINPCSFKSPDKSYSEKMAELATAYEDQMKENWPEVVSSLSVLASYDVGLYRKLKALVDELASLDVAITVANMKEEAACRTDYEGIQDEGIKNLGIYRNVRLFGDKLAKELEAISQSIR